MSVAKYYPFNGKRGRLRLGLDAIDLSEWIQYEDDFASRIRQKKELIKTHANKVLDALPSSVAIQNEFLQLVLGHLKQHHGDSFHVSQDKVESKKENIVYCLKDYQQCPLELISYLIADDFCLLEEEGEDYVLAAASVCAPTWWSLSEKIGKSLTHIHAPIKNLENTIGRMIRHFLHNLKVDDCYQRSNWFLYANSELCVFPDSVDVYSNMSRINAKNIEKKLYLRSERQTFRRLKNTNGIAFGIKVYVEPIGVAKKHPEIARDLVLALDTMSIEQKQALGINHVEKSLRDYLM